MRYWSDIVRVFGDVGACRWLCWRFVVLCRCAKPWHVQVQAVAVPIDRVTPMVCRLRVRPTQGIADACWIAYAAAGPSLRKPSGFLGTRW